LTRRGSLVKRPSERIWGMDILDRGNAGSKIDRNLESIGKGNMLDK
jgi:hypothetical protein